ncbi:MAG TPA: hypothetical protein VMW19_12265, partial [Myxococcota bacterium]|nr:hypothetical protein [Myxococcota bacterium]
MEAVNPATSGFSSGPCPEEYGNFDMVLQPDGRTAKGFYDNAGVDNVESTGSITMVRADNLADPDSCGGDKDGDDLCDNWERFGVDLQISGSFGTLVAHNPTSSNPPDLNLPALGANPDHKDLYVEVDNASGYTANLQDVVQKFAIVPNNLFAVPNPDKQPGIALHVMYGNQNIKPASFAALYPTDTPGTGSTPFSPAGWPIDFDAIKSANFGAAGFFPQGGAPGIPAAKVVGKTKAIATMLFRYVLFAQSLQNLNGKELAGLARGIPSGDAIVALGTWPNGATQDDQDGVFMHELGHTLGLGHGGRDKSGHPDNNLYKPNYRSVMNYEWMTRGYRQDLSTKLGYGSYAGCWELDYSRLDSIYISESNNDGVTPLYVLDETSVDETRGIGGRPRCQVPSGPPPAKLVPEAGSVYWLPGPLLTNAGVNFTYPGASSSGLPLHVFDPDPKVVAGWEPALLASYNDWGAISFGNGTGVSGWGAGPESQESTSEITIDEIIQLKQTPLGDCNGNGIPDADEIAANPSLDADGD